MPSLSSCSADRLSRCSPASSRRTIRSTQSILSVNEAPSAEHWLGTDQLGRDVLSRIIFGARTSLILGLSAPLLAAVIGTALGVIGGYFGGILDRLIGRVVDLLLAFPVLLLGILVAAALSSGFWSMVAVLTIALAPRFARIARASTHVAAHGAFR